MTVRLPVNGDRFRVVEIHGRDTCPSHRVGEIYTADFGNGLPQQYEGYFVYLPVNFGMPGLGTWARIEFLDEPKKDAWQFLSSKLDDVRNETAAKLGIDVPEDFDPVKKPKHYNIHPSGVECIEITRHHNFCVGNAIKYLWRQGLKDGEPSVKDLKKAAEYIRFEIARLEASNVPET